MRPSWARSVRIGSSGVLAYLCDDVDRVRFFYALFRYETNKNKQGTCPGKEEKMGLENWSAEELGRALGRMITRNPIVRIIVLIIIGIVIYLYCKK